MLVVSLCSPPTADRKIVFELIRPADAGRVLGYEKTCMTFGLTARVDGIRRFYIRILYVFYTFFRSIFGSTFFTIFYIF